MTAAPTADSAAAQTEEHTEVVRNDAERRYEIRVGGTVAGFTDIRPDTDGRDVFPHTAVLPDFEGRGLGSALVAGAMADEAARGVTVVPVCPFVVAYLRKHTVPGLQVSWQDDADPQ